MALKYLRKGHTIRTLERDSDGNVIGHSDQTFFDPMKPTIPSISAAKRESRKLQMASGGLGMGSLQVVQKFND